MEQLSPTLLGFVAEHIDSVEQLEILLLLHDHPQREWTADEVTAELRLGAGSARARLADLAVNGLLAEGTARVPRYRYAPRTPDLEAVVTELVAAHRDRRVTLIQLVYSAERPTRRQPG